MPVDGVAAITKERARQLGPLGWSEEHDDTHDDGELARAAVCYAATPRMRRVAQLVQWWPWGHPPASVSAIPHPTVAERCEQLAKAGALCAAEIDRLRRTQEPS